ncbi:hypothetical protein AVEN_217367-1 [Araneus ventricosus]|uniref:Uncharacterized protein n=1 Tax=Araneus ventricosus TaxID=182803 RepID=A0A4Y2HWT8_ARAVE|nr:hypothetical protein AVEN_217367-1 [Araneus ventricosus]
MCADASSTTSTMTLTCSHAETGGGTAAAFCFQNFLVVCSWEIQIDIQDDFATFYITPESSTPPLSRVCGFQLKIYENPSCNTLTTCPAFAIRGGRVIQFTPDATAGRGNSSVAVVLFQHGAREGPWRRNGIASEPEDFGIIRSRIIPVSFGSGGFRYDSEQKDSDIIRSRSIPVLFGAGGFQVRNRIQSSAMLWAW